jgi:hypothetical protein
MNFVIVQDSTPNLTQMTGGGYAIQDIEIHIDSALDKETQQEVVIHEILEAYLRLLDHSKIDELTSFLIEGLRQL